MDSDRLKELLENPDNVTSEHISELEELVRTYPYFQAGKVLLAKAVGSSEMIKSAASISADRTILMRLIKGNFDQDVNIPNLNDLDIDTEVNAFDQLQEDEENQVSEESSTNDEMNALLDTFEEEAEKEELGIVTPENKEDTEIIEENDKEEEISNEPKKDLGLSDYSTEDYKLPDYNYNFDSDNDSDKEEEISNVTSDDNKLTWDENFEENTFKDFDIEELKSEQPDVENEIDSSSIEEEDKFRNELMESLADLNRIRKENAELDSAKEVPEPETAKEENIGKEEEHPALETTSNKEEIITDKIEKDEIIIEEKQITNGAAENTKHVIESLKQAETISDTNQMFDDNLFELNHLIDTEKKTANTNKIDGNAHVQKEVIDRFINTIPELTAQDHDNREYSHLARDLYDKSIHADTTKMTETMAKLMITQGKLPRAIEIYEHLMLKYPEKKAYFASLIEKIREDI